MTLEIWALEIKGGMFDSEVPEAFIKCCLLCLYEPDLFREFCYESEYNRVPGSNSLQSRQEHIIT